MDTLAVLRRDSLGNYYGNCLCIPVSANTQVDAAEEQPRCLPYSYDHYSHGDPAVGIDHRRIAAGSFQRVRKY